MKPADAGWPAPHRAPTARAEGANPLSREDLLAMVHAMLEHSGGSTVTGVTLVPADGSGPVYIGAEAARRPPMHPSRRPPA